MTQPETITKLEQQLQTCLANLYNFSFLYQSPFVAQFIHEPDAATRVQHFRERMIATIEQLRPTVDVAFHARALRAYNVLNLRYVEQLDTEDVIQQLALSRRQYFREHATALETLLTLLNGQQPPSDFSTETLHAEISFDTEIASLHQTSFRTSIEFVELAQGIISATHSFSHQRGIQLLPTETTQPLVFEADRVLLRQILVSLISLYVTHLPTGTTLQCTGETTPESVIISCISDQPVTSLQSVQAQWQSNDSLHKMLQTMQAHVTLHEQHFSVHLAQTMQKQTLLVVDDNPDLIDLFQRYLTHQPYTLISANNGEQGIALAHEQLPSLIILDIMLPHQDGLEVLQRLKTSDMTKHIPILICSVLDSHDIVSSLGADGFIRKPPGQTELLLALQHHLA